jgi:hypothetical protein
MKRTDNFSKFVVQKKNSAIKEEFRQEKKKWKKEVFASKLMIFYKETWILESKSSLNLFICHSQKPDSLSGKADKERLTFV